ncbi:hypothetical protein OHB28_09545 [Streptomyces sp. NBC_00356]
MGEGSVPAGFEGGEEPGVDAVGNVGVDVVDAFEGVAEAAGLGNVRDVVLDEPSLVGVAEVVERQAGFERGPDGVVGEGSSAGSGGPEAAGEGGAAQVVAAEAGEEGLVRVTGLVLLEEGVEEGREGDGADGGGGFGRAVGVAAVDFEEIACVAVDGEGWWTPVS